ncbi:MAG: hypothetical protein Q7P63_05115 [Verrucomicrobiota bacterium JB022]|nr:hypothetical protein [Verrucomicrobiota bacterium JB022]
MLRFPLFLLLCLCVHLAQAAQSDDELILGHVRELLSASGQADKVSYRIDASLENPEVFRLERKGGAVEVVAGGAPGVFYGAQETVLPHSVVEAEGAPDFDIRGSVLMMLSASWAYQSDLSPETYPWFFDRELMTRYLDYIASARINTLIVWSGHLFPHILELPGYPDASQFSDEEIRRNQEQFRWLATEAAKRNISVLTHFYNIHISEHMAEAMHREPTEGDDPTRYQVPDQFVSDYYYTILSRYFEEFPHVGLYVCPGESLKLEHQEAWFRDVIFKAAQDSGKDPLLIIRDWTLDDDFKAALPGMYDNLYSELKHNDETITSPWPDVRHEEWKGFLKGHIVNLHDPADTTPYRVGSPRLIGEMVRHWDEAGWFKGAWFYPPQCWIWPDTLDITEDGEPLVNFDRDELWHLLEGRHLWQAGREIEADHQWASAWLGRKFDNPQVGPLLTDWYDLTGPILPGLQNLTATRFGNFFPAAIATVQANVDDILTYRVRLDDPRPEGPTGYTHQRYYSQPVDEYTIEQYSERHQPGELKDLRSLPVAQLGVELAAGRDGSGYLRPDYLLQTYLAMAKEALAKAEAAAALPSNDPAELQRFVQDSRCLVLTVEYYQLKVDAALEKRMYQLTGRKARLETFEQLMEDSVAKYEELIDYARQYYTGGTPMFHALTWEQTLKMRVQWDYELQMKWLEGLNR